MLIWLKSTSSTKVHTRPTEDFTCHSRIDTIRFPSTIFRFRRVAKVQLFSFLSATCNVVVYQCLLNAFLFEGYLTILCAIWCNNFRKLLLPQQTRSFTFSTSHVQAWLDLIYDQTTISIFLGIVCILLKRLPWTSNEAWVLDQWLLVGQTLLR